MVKYLLDADDVIQSGFWTPANLPVFGTGVATVATYTSMQHEPREGLQEQLEERERQVTSRTLLASGR